MNVLIIPSWYETTRNPTLGSFFKEQAIALKKSGHNVSLIYSGLISKSDIRDTNFKIQKFVDNGVNIYRLNSPSFGINRVKKLEAWLFEKKLGYIFKKLSNEIGKIDIVHAHSCLWAGYSAINIFKKYNIPVIITEHSTAFPKMQLTDYEKRCVEKCLNECDGFICVSNDLGRYLNEYNKFNKEIKIIPNMVNTRKFKCNNEITKEEKFKFISIAYLTHKKGIDVLINAFNKAFGNNKNIELLIGGDGDQYNNLIKLRDRLEARDRIKFLGALEREQVVSAINKSNVFVLPSRFETFGVVFIEATSMGKPIIASKCGGPNDIVTQNNGLLVNVDDIDDLASAMKKIYINYKGYDSKLITQECISRFSEEAVVEKLESYYKEIINCQSQKV